MTNSIFYARTVHLIAASIFAAVTTTTVIAGEVQLPDGNLNGASGNCPINATAATLKFENKEWTIKIGGRLALPTHKGDDWEFVCTADGVTITTGTGCFFDGYIVAGFENEAVRISCYEGKIPKNLR